jgi:hypothetical protein
MFHLPSLEHLNKRKELRVECNETLDNTHGVPHFVCLLRREDDTDCRLRRAFQHVLTFLIEAGGDSVSVLESND